MKTISVGELRQNPTAMLDDVEAGESYTVTRHHRTIARVIPPASETAFIPARKRSGFTALEVYENPDVAGSGLTSEELYDWNRSERV